MCTCVCDLALCPLGTRGKGTLRIYPWGRVPTHPVRIDGLKMSALYEQMIRPSWGWWCLVKRWMPWWSCVCGPSNVLLHELVIYCDSTWYIIHTYIRVELLFSRKQKTAFRAYSF